MMYALLDENRFIINPLATPDPNSFTLEPGQSLVAMPDDVPTFAFDGNYERVGFVEPVPVDATEVTFAVMDLPPEQQAASTRRIRERLLRDSDWTQLPDSPLTPEKKAEWVLYRQALRDITLHPEFPRPPFPTPPAQS